MTVENRPAHRVWVYLFGAAGVAVVALSWMAPEPEPKRAAPVQQYESISYSQCAAQEAAMQETAPPSYGTRSVSNTSAGNTDCIR